jgi:hypothetical protein
MRGIARLLFGDDADRVLDRFNGTDGDWPGQAEQARRSGEWCGSTPGAAAVADVLRGAARAERGGRRSSGRESTR